VFKPNDIKIEDIENLKPWQLLVAVCHFGPTMKDCVNFNYGYEIKDGSIYCDSVCLDNNIEMRNPVEALSQYAGFSWKEWAKEKLIKIIKKKQNTYIDI